MNAKGGLGRGLDHLFGGDNEIIKEAEHSENSDIKAIDINQLKPGIYQPRKNFSEESLNELSISIKNQGIIQPLLVRSILGDSKKQYEIIAGERRFRAAKLAGLTEIPVIITNYSDAEAMTIAIIENLQREDLNAIDEAEAFQKLKEMLNLSQEELAGKLGKSRSSVANALRLLSLPSYIRENIVKNIISASHGRSLLAITSEGEQKILFDAIITKNLNVREVEKAIEIWKSNGKFPSYINPNSEQITNSNSISSSNSNHNEKIVSDIIKNIEAKLNDKFYKKASIRGDERKGSIKINYKNTEELQYIIDSLSLEYKI